MPHYQRVGSVPHKRHTQFRKPDGSLYSEHLVSTEGFSDIYSLVYHLHPPVVVTHIGAARSVAPRIAVEHNLQCRSFFGFEIKPEADFMKSRRMILVNEDVIISLAAPTSSMEEYFFENASADEMIFVHRGEGELRTMYGILPFGKGDHLIIPRGVIYQIAFHSAENRLLIVESSGPLRFPARYCNREGQLLEHAPFCERDIRSPGRLETFDREGEFSVLVKRGDFIIPFTYKFHPFDVTGWDGHHYPYALSVYDFEPVTGRVHQPPPVHQTFEGKNFVTCAFVPRLYDYHPDSIPAPYFHSNVDSDEVLYYVEGEFMSRSHVKEGQITLHPTGIPHGPHPGTVEKSIGKKETKELAIMIDTFRPLRLTREALDIEDPGYYKSWIEEKKQ